MYEELKSWYTRSGLPLKKFFNTSGMYVILTGFKEKEWAEKLKG